MSYTVPRATSFESRSQQGIGGRRKLLADVLSRWFRAAGKGLLQVLCLLFNACGQATCTLASIIFSHLRSYWITRKSSGTVSLTALSPCGRYVAVALRYQYVKVFRLEDGVNLFSSVKNPDVKHLHDLCWVDNGHLVVTTDYLALSWQLDLSGVRTSTFPSQRVSLPMREPRIAALEFGEVIFYGTNYSSVARYSVFTGECQRIQSTFGPVQYCTFTSSHCRVVIATSTAICSLSLDTCEQRLIVNLTEKEAVAKMDNQMTLPREQVIRTDRTGNSKVFVGGISHDTSAEDLRSDKNSPYGIVSAVAVAVAVAALVADLSIAEKVAGNSLRELSELATNPLTEASLTTAVVSANETEKTLNEVGVVDFSLEVVEEWLRGAVVALLAVHQQRRSYLSRLSTSRWMSASANWTRCQGSGVYQVSSPL